jgi:microtubule-associated protein-like 6
MDRAEPPVLLATCKGHSSFIKHLDWSADGAFLRSNCGAYELLFWDARSGAQLPGGASDLRDCAWSSTTVTLGWDVQGIWPPGAMGCQVNALAKSPQVR